MQKKRHVAVVLKLGGPYKKGYGVLTGFRAYAESHGNWSFELGTHLGHRREGEGWYDGVIGEISEETVALAEDAGIPVVSVNLGSPASPHVPRVHTDHRAVGRMAAEHLVSRGFRHLSHWGYTGNAASKLHYEGMYEVAQEHGCSCVRHTVSSSLEVTRDRWLRFVDRVKKIQSEWDAPHGAGFVADDLCRSVTSICLSMGCHIPEQLATVSAGNHEVICTAVEPKLSSIAMSDYQCGYEAAKLLDRLMQGHAPPTGSICVPPGHLIVRHSSDVFAVDDPNVVRALRYMVDHSREKLSVPLIAKAAGLGRQPLEERFKRHMGRTIHEELIRLRVQTLKRLLVESGRPIKAVSAEAGFGTTVGMHTMFKRHTGMTPKEYRVKHGQGS